MQHCYIVKEWRVIGLKRVVVTGMGAITPIGNSVEEFWEGVKADRLRSKTGSRGERISAKRKNGF